MPGKRHARPPGEPDSARDRRRVGAVDVAPVEPVARFRQPSCLAAEGCGGRIHLVERDAVGEVGEGAEVGPVGEKGGELSPYDLSRGRIVYRYK